jgi:hypothetical protein
MTEVTEDLLHAVKNVAPGRLIVATAGPAVATDQIEKT